MGGQTDGRLAMAILVGAYARAQLSAGYTVNTYSV